MASVIAVKAQLLNLVGAIEARAIKMLYEGTVEGALLDYKVVEGRSLRR